MNILIPVGKEGLFRFLGCISMNFKKIIMTLPMCWIVNAYSTQIPQYFPLQVQLEKNNFFSQEITRFEFVPSAILLTYNKDTDTFQDENTDLVVESTVPETDQDILLAVKMTDATTSCTGFDGNTVDDSNNLVNVFLEESEMVIDQPLDLPFNEVVLGNKAATYDTRLSFNEVPYDAIYCSGSVTMMLEFSI